MKRISTITVNYNTADLTLGGIASLTAATVDGYDVQINVVDNASSGDDAETLENAISMNGWADQVAFYPEQINHGFGRGNNVVLNRLAKSEPAPDYVFFLNPDASIRPDTLSVLAHFLDDNPKVAVAGARIDNPETDSTEVSAFRFPTLLTEFVSALQFGPVSRLFSSGLISLGTDVPTSRVDWVSGAAFMARFDALKDVGFFNDAFFLYYEEVDMMRQLHLAGWQTWHVAEAHVLHASGASTGVGREEGPRAKRLPEYWYESWRIYMMKNHGVAYTVLCGGLKILGWSMNRAIRGIQGKKSEAPEAFLGDVWRIGIKRAITNPRSVA